MTTPALAPPRFTQAEIADAFQALEWGRAWRAIMGHSARVNRLAKFLATLAPQAKKEARRLILTPEEARRYPPISGLIHRNLPTGQIWRPR